MVYSIFFTNLLVLILLFGSYCSKQTVCFFTTFFALNIFTFTLFRINLPNSYFNYQIHDFFFIFQDYFKVWVLWRHFSENLIINFYIPFTFLLKYSLESNKYIARKVFREHKRTLCTFVFDQDHLRLSIMLSS